MSRSVSMSVSGRCGERSSRVWLVWLGYDTICGATLLCRSKMHTTALPVRLERTGLEKAFFRFVRQGWLYPASTPPENLCPPTPLPSLHLLLCYFSNGKVAWGMHCLCSALKFLHEDCKLYHNNISTDTVFVTRYPTTHK